MKRFSELEMRILCELEEAGEETPAGILNTVATSTGQDKELADYLEALINLIQLGMVGMAFERDRSRKLAAGTTAHALTSVGLLKSNLRFDSSRRIWVDNRTGGPPFEELFPYIIDTEAGRTAAQEILTERGYQWWRQRV